MGSQREKESIGYFVSSFCHFFLRFFFFFYKKKFLAQLGYMIVWKEASLSLSQGRWLCGNFFTELLGKIMALNMYKLDGDIMKKPLQFPSIFISTGNECNFQNILVNKSYQLPLHQFYWKCRANQSDHINGWCLSMVPGIIMSQCGIKLPHTLANWHQFRAIILELEEEMQFRDFFPEVLYNFKSSKWGNHRIKTDPKV